MTSKIADTPFIRTMFRALDMCLPLLILTIAVFAWTTLVLEPGLPQLLPFAMMLIATVGLIMSIHGWFSDAPLLQHGTKVLVAALSIGVLVQPAMPLALGMAGAVLALSVVGWLRTRSLARRAEPQLT